MLPFLMLGSVGVIFNSREDWTPSVDTSTEIKEEAPELSVKIKGRWDDDTLDSRQPSQADWIRQYVEQQQEVQKQITSAYIPPPHTTHTPPRKIKEKKIYAPNKMLKLPSRF